MSFEEYFDVKLYPFQETGVRWLQSRRSALLADEMGLGKTVQAVRAVRDLMIKKTLVICPASLKYVWDRTIKTWAAETGEIQIINSGRDTLKNSAWTVVNYDLLLNRSIFEQIAKRKYDVGVFDEAHYLKSMNSKRTKIILLKGGVASRCDRQWFLTGTPVLNRPIELFPLLKAAAPDIIQPFTTHIGYAQYFCGGFYDNFGFNDRGASHISELNDRLTRSGFMLRRTKAAVLPELPEKTFEIIPIDIKARSEFEFFWTKDDLSKKSFGDFFNKEDPGMLGKIASLRQYIALEKVKTVVSHIKDLLLEKEKVVIFAHHREVIEQLKNALYQYEPAIIIGGMNAEKKNEAENRFQTDKRCRVFLGNIIAAGVGITLTAADTAIFAELDWVPGNMFQATDRIHRIGQRNACTIQMFVTKDTVEEYILRRLVEKKSVCEQVLEDKEYIFT